MANVYEFQANTITGETIGLEKFKDQVLLIVNVASECGLTPQYTGLQALQEQYSAQGFQVIGFPCNQFGAQEPGSEAEIQSFCQTQYGVNFPMMSKIEVNGEGRDPLYVYLAGDGATFPGDIGWNFEKFLIGKNGEVLKRFSPQTEPQAKEVTEAIQQAISA